VNRGMGKVSLYGRILTVALTPLAVLAGDYFFFVLSIAKQTAQPITGALAALVADQFVDLEFNQSSGFASLIFGLVGAGYILFLTRPPVAARRMIPVPAADRAAPSTSAPGATAPAMPRRDEPATRTEAARELSLTR